VPKIVQAKIDFLTDTRAHANNRNPLEMPKSQHPCHQKEHKPAVITDKYFYGDNHFVDKIFKNAKLGEIKTLTISFRDSFGNQIQGGKYIDTVSSSTDKLSTTDTTTVTTVYNDSVSYIRHPYYRDFQVSLMFKVGCYETEIDKKLFF
jgi:hypothetical protein